jgi:hypothetical protein
MMTYDVVVGFLDEVGYLVMEWSYIVYTEINVL